MLVISAYYNIHGACTSEFSGIPRFFLPTRLNISPDDYLSDGSYISISYVALIFTLSLSLRKKNSNFAPNL